MIREQPFGFPRVFGFGDGRHSRGRYPIEYYFSQGMQKTLWGLMTGYGVAEIKNSDSLSGLGTIQWFADAGGKVYAVNTGGDILKESFPLANDWAIDHSPSGSTYSGNGLIGDQKGRLLYVGDTAIGKLDGGTYTDGWKTGLTSYANHPADTYEDMVFIGNKNAVALIDGTDNLNLTAFTLPSSMTVDCLVAGKTGLLLGANLGYRGALILWDAQADRSITPWIWTNGKVLSITRVDNGWIVVTQKEILLTNGYTVKKLFALLDDPLGVSEYKVSAQGTLVVNDKLLICAQTGSARGAAGLYVFDLATTLFEYVPMSQYGASPIAIYSAKSSFLEISLSYSDSTMVKTYLGQLVTTATSKGVYIPEILADTTPTDKAAEAVILNPALSYMKTGVQAITFTISVKLYNFKRSLYGAQETSVISPATNKLTVFGDNTSFRHARIGDEVTVNEGVNAGEIRHITAIASAGTSSETWTLDSALPNLTESAILLSVQPFQLVEKKTISAASEIPELFFNVKNKVRGKKFLVKVVIEGMTNAQVELQRSTFVYDDLGYNT